MRAMPELAVPGATYRRAWKVHFLINSPNSKHSIFEYYQYALLSRNDGCGIVFLNIYCFIGCTSGASFAEAPVDFSRPYIFHWTPHIWSPTLYFR
jgi:hypothetical protein